METAQKASGTPKNPTQTHFDKAVIDNAVTAVLADVDSEVNAQPFTDEDAAQLVPAVAAANSNLPYWELDNDFLDPTQEPPQIITWAMVDGKPILEKQGLVAIHAKPKQGKSCIAYALLAALVSDTPLFGIDVADKPKRIIIFDTEMPKTSLSIRYKMINNTLGKKFDDRIGIVPLKGMPADQAKQKINAKINRYQPDIVMIDTITWFVDDYNNAAENTELATFLNQIAAERTLIVIAHDNKAVGNDQMKGSTGANVKQLEQEDYSAKCDKGVFSLYPVDARDWLVDRTTPLFAFTIDEHENKLIDATAVKTAMANKTAARKQELRALMAEAFNTSQKFSLGQKELARQLNQLHEETSARKFEDAIREAKQFGILEQTQKDNHKSPLKLAQKY